ncbi:MAG: DUF4199 domain-containing protein [Prolixibacteraceae bacterium]
MEHKSTSVWKSAITSGVYVGIALILISVIYYVSGNVFSKSAQWVGYLVMTGGVIFAQLSYRKSLGGFMTYGQALLVGVLAMLFAAVLSGIYTWFLYSVVDPSLQEQLQLATEEQLVKQGNIPEDQLEAAVEMTAKFQNPVMLMLIAIFGGTFIGLIISLITSIFTQKKPSDVTED